MKMSKKIKIISCIVFVIVIVPLLIHTLYKINCSDSFFQAEWTAGDVLTAYASLLGAGATIIAVYKTINFTKISQIEERRLAVRPYLNHTLFVGNKVLNEKDSICTLIIEQHENKSYKYSTTSTKNDDFLNNDDYLVFGFSIQNVGAGNAIEVNIKVGDKNVCVKDCIKCNEVFYYRIALINREIKKSNNVNYYFNISYTYSDIISSKIYHQSSMFEVNGNKYGYQVCPNTKLSKPE